ncbi:protein Shroom1 [Elgaria multicarinata webbii]|uniref:protein Shroom1 n=1 Tax=Elgaria multicarinata webbii TaxID=159646 RepID=UPI002FCCB8E9
MSYESEVSKWNLRHVRGIAELLQPVASPRDANRFLPEKPASGIDQCLHIPGKADSAYSSFSGGSNLPEYPTPLCYSEHDSLPLEQLPYMDSGYVRSIYNPSAIHFQLRQMYENKTERKSSHYKLEGIGRSRPFGSTPTPGMLYQPPSPQVRFTAHPPSPPARVDSYEVNRNIDRSPSEICFDHSIQTEVCVQDSSKDLPFDSTGNCYNASWLSSWEDESPVSEQGDIWHPPNQYTTKKNNSTISTKTSLIIQENLKSGSLAKTQKILCAQNSVHAYKIPEALNSKSSPSLRTSHNAVNDTQENKQYFYACSVHKPPFAEADLPSTVAVSSKRDGQLCGALRMFRVDTPSGLDPEFCESGSSLKYMDSSLPDKTAVRIINSYENKKHSFSSEEENSIDVWQPLTEQQTSMQKPPSHGLNLAETPHNEIYEAANTISYYSCDAEESTSQSINGFRKAEQNDNNSIPDLLTNPRQEEVLKPVHFPKQQSSKKAESQSQDNSASVKINRKTTPLLYYLSGGKHSNFMSHKNQAQEQDVFSMESSRSNHPVSAEPVEIPRDSNSHVNEIAGKDEEFILESPASSVDEKFKNDYREKLKVAQRKVLRETSFKRKDLQMSLPIRLKQKPSARPSIQHLRSLSLSSTTEDSTLVPPLKPLEIISKEEESKRPQAIHIGGRKRATKEQKKISYSEPEKLNQLDDQRDQSASWRQKNARSRSDEINEQDTRIVRGKALENQGKALSKAELKQIQHNALLEYMERKIGQRPATAKNSAQQKPPLQPRASHSKRFLEDGTSNPSTSRKLQNMDGFFQFPAPGGIPEPPTFSSASTSATATDRCSARSPVSEIANSKVQAAVSEGSCASKCASTKSLLHSGSSASSKGRGRSKSAPSPVQDFYRSTTCSALSAQDQEYYPMCPNSPSQEKLEVSPSDGTDVYVAGRQGKSMEETGTSEMVQLSPLTQSTDQLHHLKGWLVFPGLENSKNHPNVSQNCESALRHLPRQPHATGVAGGLRGLNLTAHELEQPHTANSQSMSTSIGLGNPYLGHGPLHPMGWWPSTSVPLESLHSSLASSPAEADNDAFSNSYFSGSELAPNLPSFHGHSQRSSPDQKPPAAPALPVSTEGKPIKEEHNISFPVPEKEGSNLGDSRDDLNYAQNPYRAEMALELPAFFSKEKSDKHSHLKRDFSEKSQVSSAAGRTQWQHLETNGTTHHSENRTYSYTALLENQEHHNISIPLANLKALQSEYNHSFPAQDIDVSIAQSKSLEDQRCEDLAIEIIAKDKTLVDILMPHPVRKTVLDLMEGLFPVNISVSGRSCRRNQRSSQHATDLSHETRNSLGQRVEDATLHISQILSKSRENLEDPDSITSKKRELISSIQQKLQALWDERELIQSEAKEHAVRSKELESMVQDLCKPNEYERYMMFIGDLEKVVSLLLCLSSRLARVQNAMGKMDENTDAEEKQSLNERHKLLSRQREDAKDLKENLDRRERVVSGILSKYMSESQLEDYRHFIQEKTSLQIEQKDLEEQIKFLEEQLERLEKSIPP